MHSGFIIRWPLTPARANEAATSQQPGSGNMRIGTQRAPRATTYGATHDAPLCGYAELLARVREEMREGTFEQAEGLPVSYDEDVIRLDSALTELARLNPRQAQMVESRFFGGLDITETAHLLGVSEATILRDWRAAKAWLAHALREVH